MDRLLSVSLEIFKINILSNIKLTKNFKGSKWGNMHLNHAFEMCLQTTVRLNSGESIEERKCIPQERIECAFFM